MLAGSATLRRGVPVFTVERGCLFGREAPQASAAVEDVMLLRRDSGRLFSFRLPFWGTPKKRAAEKQRSSDIQHNRSLFPVALPFRQIGGITLYYV